MIETRDKTILDLPSVRRRRECPAGHRFTTYEVSGADLVGSRMAMARSGVVRKHLLELAALLADEPALVDVDITQPAPLGD